MISVEVFGLGEPFPDRPKREFDAISGAGDRHFLWRGLLSYERFNGGSLVVYSNREDPLGNEYAVRPGKAEEVYDEALAVAAIQKAVPVFDHRLTFEALPNGKGGWIPFETDT